MSLTSTEAILIACALILALAFLYLFYHFQRNRSDFNRLKGRKRVNTRLLRRHTEINARNNGGFTCEAMLIAILGAVVVVGLSAFFVAAFSDLP